MADFLIYALVPIAGHSAGLLFAAGQAFGALAVTTTTNGNALANTILGPGVTIVGPVSYIGATTQAGTFTGGVSEASKSRDKAEKKRARTAGLPGVASRQAQFGGDSAKTQQGQ